MSTPSAWSLSSKQWIVPVIIILLVGSFFCRWLPHHSLTATAGDSGIFLYIGQQINNGLTPYSDLWDDKAPLMFYLNAFGLRLSHGDPVGVVFLAGVFVTIFFVFMWLTIKRANGSAAALCAVLLTLNVLPSVLVSPNLSEVFSLGFQAVSFFITVKALEDSPLLWQSFVQGILAAALLQLRLNNTGATAVYVLAGVYFFLRDKAFISLLRHSIAFLVSFVLTNGLILLQLIQSDRVKEYVDAVFLYGVHYSSSGSFIRHFYAVGVGLLTLSGYGATVICAAGIAVTIAARKRIRWSDGPHARYTILASLLLLIELAGSSVSGKAFEHYFSMWLLPVGLFVGMFIRQCETVAAAAGLQGLSFAHAAFLGICALLGVSSLFDSARSYAEVLVKFKDTRAPLVRFVRERATPSDSVFVWGEFGDLDFRLGLKPASRHFSSVGMSMDPASYRLLGSEALHDVEKSKPRFIIESSLVDVPPLFRASSPADGSGRVDVLKEMKDRLGKNYRLIRDDAASGIKVYEFGTSPTMAPDASRTPGR